MAAARLLDGPIGIWGVLAPASIVLSAVAAMVVWALRVRPMRDLDQAAACELLAVALATEMGVNRSERAWVPQVVRALGELRRSGALFAAYADDCLGTLRFTRGAVSSIDDAVRAAYAVPACSAPRTPLLARIVAVADEWATLTAGGPRELSHAEALTLLSWAGRRFDRDAVAAALAIVSRERRLTNEPAFQPRLHRRPSLDPVAFLRLLFTSGLPPSNDARSRQLSDRLSSGPAPDARLAAPKRS